MYNRTSTADREILGTQSSYIAGTSNPVRPTLDSTDFHHISQKLSGQIIEMNQPEVISSTKIKITWQVSKCGGIVVMGDGCLER